MADSETKERAQTKGYTKKRQPTDAQLSTQLTDNKSTANKTNQT